MTRKHFIVIANKISKIANYGDRRVAAETAAELCAASNPRFDYARFFTACSAVCPPDRTPRIGK